MLQKRATARKAERSLDDRRTSKESKIKMVFNPLLF